MTVLDQLVKLEGKYGMIGTIVGIIIIVACIVASMLILNLLMKINFQIIDWVCRELWGFKFL